MLLIQLSVKSRRGIDVDTINRRLARLLRDPELVGQLVDRNDHDSEKLFAVTAEIGQPNRVTVTQTGEINGQWFDRTHQARQRFEYAVFDAVNAGLKSHIRRDKFVFTINAVTGQALPIVASAGTGVRPRHRGQSTYHPRSGPVSSAPTN